MVYRLSTGTRTGNIGRCVAPLMACSLGLPPWRPGRSEVPDITRCTVDDSIAGLSVGPLTTCGKYGLLPCHDT